MCVQLSLSPALKMQHSDKFPEISDQTRYGVSCATKASLLQFCQLDPKGDFAAQITQHFSQKRVALLQKPELQEMTKKIHLFTSADSKDTFFEKSLLGRFCVLAVPCRMEFDAHWKKSLSKSPFYVHHAAALNIGESARAEDFKDYSSSSQTLDEKRYIVDMQKLFHNILSAQKACGVKHVVWFPFGMGAFLRHLDKLDPSYKSQQKISELREKVARAFVRELAHFPDFTVHLCLPLEMGVESSATNQNYTAFIKALQDAAPSLKQQVTVYVNHDATQVAQLLADKHGSFSVSLANGANRKLIGNHWFGGGARVAIDENIHRRSRLASLMAILVNDGSATCARTPGELAKRIIALGGTCSQR